MLHPSYTDLMKVVNSEVGEGDTPVVNSPLFHRNGDGQESPPDYCRAG